MPADAQHISKEEKYFHIYNEGRENKVIFNDQEDYNTFLKFIKEYVTEPVDPNSAKKSFTVQGKTYHGIPHLPKNFHNKIALVGYSLMPSRFHLVLKQSENNAVESFIRSLCTRYSIYFNKKYKRTGSLFEGPYKTVSVNAGKQLSLLVRYLHQMGGLSSVHQYINGGIPNWLSTHPTIKSYNDFLNNYSLTRDENTLLDSVTFKHKTFANQPENESVLTPVIEQKKSKYLKAHQRGLELLLASTAFVFLFSFGLRNVLIKNAKATENNVAESQVLEVGQVAGVSIDSLEETYNNPIKVAATIKTDKQFIDIYSDMDTTSDRIDTARSGEQYEIVAKNNEWYEIQLPYYQKGFVEAKYIVETEVSAK